MYIEKARLLSLNNDRMSPYIKKLGQALATKIKASLAEVCSAQHVK
ncbi:hypothetical protein Hanom_Chr13g01203821 [Helianthus anomalus]